jgi:hypothetical protein
VADDLYRALRPSSESGVYLVDGGPNAVVDLIPMALVDQDVAEEAGYAWSLLRPQIGVQSAGCGAHGRANDAV